MTDAELAIAELAAQTGEREDDVKDRLIVEGLTRLGLLTVDGRRPVELP